jgi:hypothetical protein
MTDSILSHLFSGYTIILLAVLAVVLSFATKNLCLSHWHHTFDQVQFSAMDFYDLTEGEIGRRELPGLSMRRVTHGEKVLFGARREYLRVYTTENAFEICAAPVGTGFYVSWWFFEKSNRLRSLMLGVPFLNWLVTAKTLHQLDEEQVLRDLVHTCVLQGIDAMTGQSGSTLSESERAIINIGNYPI